MTEWEAIQKISPTDERRVSTEVDGVSYIDDWLHLSRRGYVFASILGIAIMLAFMHGQLNWSSNTSGDFPQFYAGARLAGTPYLYDAPHVWAEQGRAFGAYGKALQYVRLPYYAVLLSPLAHMPYRVAQVVWQSLSFLAVCGFILLWRVPSRRMTLLATCWSLPVFMILLLCQDVSFVLLILAIAVRLHSRGNELPAGMVMSFLSIKFNLFLLLPLLFIGQRRWKLASGFVAGCVVLIAVSFAVAGLRWPIEMAKVLSSRAIAPREYLMPNLRGFLSLFTSNLWPEVTLSIAVAAVTLYIVRKSNFAVGLAAVIVGSLLISHHAGPQDCALLVPAILLLLPGTGQPRAKLIYFMAFLPVPYVLLLIPAVSAITQLLIVLLLVTIATEARKLGHIAIM